MRYVNLCLLILFPISWFAPLVRAGFLPLFGLSEISVISGLQSLWESDVFLALLVTFCAVFAPILKIMGRALCDFHLLSHRVEPALYILGKLAMVDVFLIALYIIIIKSADLGHIETAWGLYLFSFCALSAFMMSLLPRPKVRLHG